MPSTSQLTLYRSMTRSRRYVFRHVTIPGDDMCCEPNSNSLTERNVKISLPLVLFFAAMWATLTGALQSMARSNNHIESLVWMTEYLWRPNT